MEKLKENNIKQVEIIKIEKSNNKREINFEFIRILSMILIIMTHYCTHGRVNDTLCPNRIIGDFICISGNMCLNLFMMLTGYFMVNGKFKIKKLLKMECQVLFYSIILGLIGIFIDSKRINMNNILNLLLPTANAAYWFVSIYMIIYALSPYLKKLINQLNKKQFEILLVIISVVFILASLSTLSILPTVMQKLCVNKITACIFAYLIGAYIKKYDITLFKNKNYINVILSLVGLLIIFGLYEKILNQTLVQQYSPISLLTSIVTFMFFKNLNLNKTENKTKSNRNLKEKVDKAILFLSKSSFGVYLLHENDFIRSVLWDKIIGVKNMYFKPHLIFIGHVLLCAIIIYLIGTITEFIRTLLIEKVTFEDKLGRKINEWCLKIDNIMNE